MSNIFQYYPFNTFTQEELVITQVLNKITGEHELAIVMRSVIKTEEDYRNDFIKIWKAGQDQNM